MQVLTKIAQGVRALSFEDSNTAPKGPFAYVTEEDTPVVMLPEREWIAALKGLNHLTKENEFIYLGVVFRRKSGERTLSGS